MRFLINISDKVLKFVCPWAWNKLHFHSNMPDELLIDEEVDTQYLTIGVEHSGRIWYLLVYHPLKIPDVLVFDDITNEFYHLLVSGAIFPELPESALMTKKVAGEVLEKWKKVPHVSEVFVQEYKPKPSVSKAAILPETSLSFPQVEREVSKEERDAFNKALEKKLKRAKKK